MTKHPFKKLDDDDEPTLPSAWGEPSRPDASAGATLNMVSVANDVQTSDQHLHHRTNAPFHPPPGLDPRYPHGGRDEHVTVESRYYDPNKMKSKWKKSLYLILEDPSHSRLAFWVNVAVSLLILVSIILTTVETIPEARAIGDGVWFKIETAFVFTFTIELILRLIAHSDSLRLLGAFFTSPLVILDFAAILPYYIEIIARQSAVYEFRFTILRVFRLLRIFKPYKYTSTIVMTIEVLFIAMGRSADALGALLFFMVGTVIIFSTLLYFAERGVWDAATNTFLNSQGKPSTFDSIPAAIYFTVTTITTTGYGDMVPTTFIGKLIVIPAMLFGILLIALPSIIIGRSFTITWEAMRKHHRSRSISRRAPDQAHTPENDEGGDGRGDDLYEMLENVEFFPDQTPLRAFPSPAPSSTVNTSEQAPGNTLQSTETATINDLAQRVQQLSNAVQQNQQVLMQVLKHLEGRDMVVSVPQSARLNSR
ncbi:uncharacterized protein VTP21DRAFT_3339 [Calcarisporiella thermophila]|uniref:uncharacterized protein n=1 Tax=Calcarisporiella thermophila TaxID=911321 RepID=UPI003742F5D8